MESSFHNKPSVLVGKIHSTTNDNSSSYAYKLINVILASLLNLRKTAWWKKKVRWNKEQVIFSMCWSCLRIHTGLLLGDWKQFDFALHVDI